MVAEQYKTEAHQCMNSQKLYKEGMLFLFVPSYHDSPGASRASALPRADALFNQCTANLFTKRNPFSSSSASIFTALISVGNPQFCHSVVQMRLLRGLLQAYPAEGYCRTAYRLIGDVTLETLVDLGRV